MQNEHQVLIDETEPTDILAFTTPLFNLIVHSLDTVVVDATYNTNRMKSELYCILGIIDRIGFPLFLLLKKIEIAH